MSSIRNTIVDKTREELNKIFHHVEIIFAVISGYPYSLITSIIKVFGESIRLWGIAYVQLGNEESFSHWGILSYIWAKRRQQPLIKTSGIRKGLRILA